MSLTSRKILSYLVVIALMFAPAQTLYSNSSAGHAAPEMSADMDPAIMNHSDAMAMNEKCHHNVVKKEPAKDCCCDSDADQCHCAMHMSFSMLMHSSLNIVNNLSNSEFSIYSVNHIKHDSTPLLRPPIA